MLTQIKTEDKIQKTWIPEGTLEYKTFKSITQENKFLSELLRNKFPLSQSDLLLDVSGDGQVWTMILD